MLQSDSVVRLRPTVHASPAAEGLHVRGWSQSFTMTGGRGLWKVWRALSAALTDGVAPDDLQGPQTAEPLGTVIAVLVEQLWEHGMLVTVPRWWGGEADGAPPAEMAQWLSSVAADPLDAWRRLTATCAWVTGDGPPAVAAARTFVRSGLPAPVTGTPTAMPDGAVLLGAGADTAVVAVARPEVAFVTAPGSPRAVVHAADQIIRRLDTVPSVPAHTPPVLASLAGGAAVHRLLCAVAGLLDPAAAETPGGGHPAVLVARLDPLSARYHPWLGGEASLIAEETVPLALALDRAAALCDEELGVLPPAVLGALPQIPAAIAACELPTGPVLGAGVTADVARLHATVLAAGRRLAQEHDEVVAVGVGERHSRGLALRRLAGTGPADPCHRPVAETEWRDVPQARRWWKALTLRQGVAARLRLTRIDDGVGPVGAFHAAISAAGRRLGWAVEATAGDAVAMASLAASAATQVIEAAITLPPEGLTVCGATPTEEPAPDEVATWFRGSWTWPAGLDEREKELQERLRVLPGAQELVTLETAEPDSHAAAVMRAGFVITVGTRRHA